MKLKQNFENLSDLFRKEDRNGCLVRWIVHADTNNSDRVVCQGRLFDWRNFLKIFIIISPSSIPFIGCDFPNNWTIFKKMRGILWFLLNIDSHTIKEGCWPLINWDQILIFCRSGIWKTQGVLINLNRNCSLFVAWQKRFEFNKLVRPYFLF